MTTLKEPWESYQKLVLPKDASEIQIRECQLAFYAGAGTIMELLAHVGQAGLSEAEEGKIIEGLNQEMSDFITSVCPGVPGAERPH